MNIIDKRRDFYDHFGSGFDDIVYDRKDSVSLVREYPDIFSPTSNVLGEYETRRSTLITVFAGGLRRVYVRCWEKAGNKITSSIYLTLNNLEEFDFETTSKTMRYTLGLNTTEEFPLMVCALDINPNFRIEDYIKKTIIIRNPIIFGSVLEYVLSAKEIYDSIENYLLGEW